MKVAISGSNGFIAKHLIASFQEVGYVIYPIERRLLKDQHRLALCSMLESCDVVINLAGSNINQRWTTKNKELILSSRIETTRSLVNAINSLQNKPKIFISASAIGIYENDSITDESETYYGTGFLSKVCIDWEREASKISPEVRLIITRLGVVLDKYEGAFPKIIAPFRYFLGGRIGDGEQGFSWIHIDDLISAFHFLISNENAKGVVNLTAPQNTDNQMLTNAVCDVMNRPSWFPVPLFVLYLLLGERYEIIAKGAKVYPRMLYDLGFDFKYSSIERAVYSLTN